MQTTTRLLLPLYLFVSLDTAYSQETPASASTSVCLPTSLKINSEYVTTRPRAITIAHRGASFHLPEHTLAGYRLALELGADYIEPDLVATKDTKLIAIHTVDLSITTDVAEVFGDDRKWFSPFANRSSWWTFNFTLEEIRQLTVIQRVGPARTTLYDNKYTVPTLEEILNVLYKWNIVDWPYIRFGYNESTMPDLKGNHRPSDVELEQKGLYAELKDAEWLRTEAAIDLVDLLYDHFDEHAEHWEPLQKCYKNIPYDQYRIPSLVLQSFDAVSLQDFHTRWKSSKYAGTVAEPPYILLTNFPHCSEDDFWFDIGDKYRGFLSGIGCEKRCLLDDFHGPAFLSKAEEFELVLHAWTERPEREFLFSPDSPNTATVFEEAQYLLCEMKASALFSESVTAAVMAASLPCPDKLSNATGASSTETPPDGRGGNQTSEDGSGGEIGASSSSSTPSEFCFDSSAKANLYVGLAAFVLGMFVMGLVLYCWSEKRRPNSRRRSQDANGGVRYRGTAVPTNEIHELELT